MGKITRTLPKEFNLLHVALAMSVGTILVLATIRAMAWAMGQGNKTTSLTAGLLASVVVSGFYAAPFLKGKKTAQLIYLEETNNKLFKFSLVVFVLVLISPFLFPRGWLASRQVVIDAITVVGAAAFVIFPTSIAFHTLVLLFARHIKPVKR